MTNYSKLYLWTENGRITGIPYQYPRLLGILHEMYATECRLKGTEYNMNSITKSKYNATIITHPVTGDICAEIDNETIIPGLTNKTVYDCLPEVFRDRLFTREIMEINGWFDEPSFAEVFRAKVLAGDITIIHGLFETEIPGE